MSATHENVKLALAQAIATDARTVEMCKSAFGQTPLVIVNRYGEDGFPGEDEAPFVFIYSDGESEAGDVDEETFDFCVLFGATDPSQTPRRRRLMTRTDDSAGLIVSGMAEEVEAVRERIFEIVQTSVHGAIFRSATRTESNVNDYPLEWAQLRVTYAEPDTLDG